jgi:hypothetical protein
MKNGMTACVAGTFVALWAAGTALAAESAGNPYAGIVDRNVFALKPPPPPPDPEANKPPPPKITLQGITTILGRKLVLMKVVVPPAKPGGKAEEVPLTLSVGQKSEDVEVLEIHETDPAWVKVNDYGTITNLNFKDNGVNLASVAPPGTAPAGGPPRPGVPPPGPAHAGGGGYAPNPGAYQGRSIPRASRMNPAGGASYNQGSAAPTTYSAVPGAAVATTTPATTSPGTVALNGLGAPASTIEPSKNWPPETPMTPEQAAIMEAAYTMKYQQQINAGTMPSIPGENPLINSGSTPTQHKAQSGF